MSKVLCIGDSCADIIIPYGQAKKGNDAFVSFSCGGSNANTAYGLGKLGVDASFVGKAGKDLYGLAMKKELEDAGVNTNHFLIDESMISTQILVVIDERNDRFPFLMPRENPSYLEIYPDDLKGIDISDTEYILTNGMMLFKNPAAASICDYLSVCHKQGIKIILDINYRLETINEDRSYLDEVVKISDYLLGSIDDDLLPLSGKDNLNDAIDVLQNDSNVIIARNAEGSSYFSRKEKGFCPSYKVDVIDTLGAGDAFNAGFIYGLTSNFPLDACNRYGCKVASYCIAHKGARNYPSRDSLND